MLRRVGEKRCLQKMGGEGEGGEGQGEGQQRASGWREGERERGGEGEREQGSAIQVPLQKFPIWQVKFKPIVMYL